MTAQRILVQSLGVPAVERHAVFGGCTELGVQPALLLQQADEQRVLQDHATTVSCAAVHQHVELAVIVTPAQHFSQATQFHRQGDDSQELIALHDGSGKGHLPGPGGGALKHRGQMRLLDVVSIRRALVGCATMEIGAIRVVTAHG